MASDLDYLRPIALRRLDELRLRPLTTPWLGDERPRLVSARFGVQHVDEVRLILDLNLRDFLFVHLASMPLVVAISDELFPVEILRYVPPSCFARLTPQRAVDDLLLLLAYDGIRRVETSEGWSASIQCGVSV